MPNERVIEIPWMLSKLPQSGLILDVGCCEATYLHTIQQPTRVLHCLDPRPCARDIPSQAVFFNQSIIGNTLPRGMYDAVIALSVIEHIGLPHYDQKAFGQGDRLAVAEMAALLKPGCPMLVTVPAGRSKITPWYRQYSVQDIRNLFATLEVEIDYWGLIGDQYVQISEADVNQFDYRDRHDANQGAGALSGIVARCK